MLDMLSSGRLIHQFQNDPDEACASCIILTATGVAATAATVSIAKCILNRTNHGNHPHSD
jgi:hypothetical protein